MIKKGSKFFQFNGQCWHHHLLAAGVHLLTAKGATETPTIQTAASAIENLLGNTLTDMVTAYDSITIFTSLSTRQLITALEYHTGSVPQAQAQMSAFDIPICYELGPDLAHVAKYCGLTTEQVIAAHLSGQYRVAMIGFLPGFVYAEGLDGRIHCPRKEVPVKKVKKGSVGIGGTQTGMYALDSPGGWNIIGRTPLCLFDPNKTQPVAMPTGSIFMFRRISKREFEQWER